MASTLADTFLDDLDELGEDSDEEEEEEGNQDEAANKDEDGTKDKKLDSKSAAMMADLDALDDDDSSSDEEEEGGDGKDGMDLDQVLGQIAGRGLQAVAQLRSSLQFVEHMAKVEQALQSGLGETSRFAGSRLESNPEYKLIVESNQLMQDIDEEIVNIHRYVCDVYSKKFPELESLLPNKLEYMQVVMRIGNEMDMTLVDLNDLLPSASVMLVSVTGSTTSGQPLSESDLKECLDGAKETIDLDHAKNQILKFVESRMTQIAPNVSALLGSSLAAVMMGLCGGLIAMSKIPCCNLQVMGQEKRALAGFGAAAAMKHTGIIYYSEVVQSAPVYLRQKALKVTAAKVALAARVDSYQTAHSGAVGKKYREEVQSKIEKWQEPQQSKQKKARPKPDASKKTKRGGKRVRKFKEKFAVTDVRKELNRRSFAKLDSEYSDDAMGYEFGMLGKAGSRLRAPPKKEQKQKLKAQRRVANLSSGATNGLASSLVFTPVQGIELVDPSAASERVKNANKKWFDDSSGFMSAKPK
mmetsp:Transcript_7347/g.9797  ORF Transcript_7347/g.9797 Transcript_7347/m.9797 type:complete len:526 (-) Transcript_7347:298-1875(-)